MNAILAILLSVLAATPRVPTAEQERIALLERIEKSVVLIRTIEDQGEAVGSGVIASADGLVITAAHVVAEARSLDITLFDGSRTAAAVVYVDDALDIALLRLSQPPPPSAVAVLGDSDQLRKGATLYVIGNPVGLELSVATGIVSGRHSAEHVFGRQTGDITRELIQTDAAMNRGVSGGPMFNSRGEVVAIAQTILSKSGGSEGLGFGLSVNTVKQILQRDPCLYLGFSAIPLSGELADAFNIGTTAGLLVQFVAPGSPAERAGLREGTIVIGSGPDRVLLGGDIITHVDGFTVDAWKREPFANAREGESHEITFRVIRHGEVTELKSATVHRAQRWN